MDDPMLPVALTMVGRMKGATGPELRSKEFVRALLGSEGRAALRRAEEPFREKVKAHLLAALKAACAGKVDQMAAKALTPESLCTEVHDRRQAKGLSPVFDLWLAISEWTSAGGKGPPPVIRRMVTEWLEQRLATLRPGRKGGLIPAGKGIAVVPNLALVTGERASQLAAEGTFGDACLSTEFDTEGNLLPDVPNDGWLSPGYDLETRLLDAPPAPMFWAVADMKARGALEGRGRGGSLETTLRHEFMMRTPLMQPDSFGYRQAFCPVRVRDEAAFQNGEESVLRVLYPNGIKEAHLTGSPGQWEDPENPPIFRRLQKAMLLVDRRRTPLPGQPHGVRLVEIPFIPGPRATRFLVRVFDAGTGPRGVGMSRQMHRAYRLESGNMQAGYMAARYLLGWVGNDGKRRFPRGLERIGRDGITPGMLAWQFGRGFRNDGSKHDRDQVRAAWKTLLALAGDGVAFFETEGTRRNARIFLRELETSEMEKQKAAEARVRAHPPKTGLREAVRRARRKAVGMQEG